MEGTYGRPFRSERSMSPMSANTPTSAGGPGQYKTNMNRTKTKKWVEAKKQTYDGGDWGDDLDDEEELEDEPEPVAAPPPKQSAFDLRRQLAAAAAAQTPASHPAGFLPSQQQQYQATPPEFPASNQPRSPAGLPPLQTQQLGWRGRPGHVEEVQAQGPGGRPSFASPTGQRSLDQNASPQSVNVLPSASSVYTTHPPSTASPLSQRHMSPAPQNSAPAPSRFPPRKSSMGQQDAYEAGDLPRAVGLGPRRGSGTGKTEQAAQPATRAKSPPFVRPADIYKRMSEENERAQRSTDSGRQSMDSLVGRQSLDKSEPDQTGEGSRGSLPTVAERKSEYGLDGFLAGSQSRPGTHQRKGTDGTLTSGGELEGSRRISNTSPKLPDVARMSGFGADFLNPSGLMSEARSTPSFPDEEQSGRLPSQQVDVESPQTARQVPFDHSPAPNSSQAPRQPAPNFETGASAAAEGQEQDGRNGSEANASNVGSDARPAGEANANQRAPGSSENAQSARDTPAAESKERRHEPRPSIPGGWVSETVSVFTADPATTPAAKENVGGVFKIEEEGGDSERAENMSDAGADRQSTRQQPGAPTHHPSPYSLPPLKTDDPKAAMAKQPDSPATATTAPDISPTKPLNPQRGKPVSPHDIVAPVFPQRNPTMSTTATSSPVKESDKLREEIIRTLSPVKTQGEFEGTVNEKVGGQKDGSPVRDSAYLPDVYDDYFSPTEETPPPLPATGSASNNKLETAVRAQASGSEMTGAQQAAGLPSPSSQKNRSQDSRPGLGHHRFSWEMSGETVNAVSAGVTPSEPAATGELLSSSGEARLPGSNVDASAEASTKSLQQPSPGLPGAPGKTDAPHHLSQASQASINLPRVELGAPEPSSPASSLSDRNASLPAPVTGDGHRLSLADEKMLLQSTESLVLAEPQAEDHPALSTTPIPVESSQPSPSMPTLPFDPEAQPMDVMSFKDIRGLGSQEERIKKFEETRAKFATTESGLGHWILSISSQQPEYANASHSLRDFLAELPTDDSVGPLPGSSGSQHPAQQPYYQQYLNASNPNLNTANVPTRQPSHMKIMGQAGISDFKHSSNQVGAKGKELLFAAGKAGKKAGRGLLSKGKSKLKASGDKVLF